jgi:hypothetical protein
MTTKHGLVALVGALLITGCAGSSRKTLLERTGGLVVYDLPAQQVMAAAEEELGARGYALLPSTDPYFLQTPWKVSGNFDVFSAWSRRYVEGHKLPDGRFVVRAYEMAANMAARTQLLPGMATSVPTAPDEKPNTMPTVLLATEPVLVRSAHPGIRRDLAFEWAIMERLNPEFAGRVKEQVDYYLAQSTPQRTR